MVNQEDPTQVALEELAKKLVGAAFRKTLRDNWEDAKGQLEHGDDLPPELLTTLGTMSDEELKTVAIVQQQLDREFRDSVSILF